MGNYMSRTLVSAEFTFDKEWWGRHEFEEVCKAERIFVLPDMNGGGEGARKACKMVLLRERKEYNIGKAETFSCTWRIIAPEWRIWSLMERLDARKIPYETDFGLIVE